MTAQSEAKRRLHIEYAEALEADAEESGQKCNDLAEAAGYWHMAGEHERERAALRVAADVDDGTNVLSGRASYAAFLLTHGERAEGERLLKELLSERPSCEHAYSAAASGYQEIGEQDEALRWLNVGVNELIPDLEDDLEMGDPGAMLLRERWHLRRELGLPKDGYDDLEDRLRTKSERFFEHLEEVVRPEKAATASMPGAVLYWPEAEFARIQREHPDWYPDTTHLEHRQEVQRALQLATRPELAIGSIDALTDFADSCGLAVEEQSTRARFGAELARLRESVPWPPGRNEPCWCGSGRKYKKCCGAPGFTE